MISLAILAAVFGPLVLLGLLAALPRGGPALAGVVAAGLGLGYLWTRRAGGLWPFEPDAWRDVASLLLLVWTAALLGGALAQALRPALPRDRRAYPALVVLLGLTGTLAFQMIA